jgi:transposase
MAGELRRVEVITGTTRRRTWSAQEKARMVAESVEPGANVSEVARRHGVNRGQLFTWRRQAMRSGSVDDGTNAPTFVPVSMAPSEEPGVEQSSSIEIEMGVSVARRSRFWLSRACRSVRIQVRGGVNGAALRTVLLAVRSVR